MQIFHRLNSAPSTVERDVSIPAARKPNFREHHVTASKAQNRDKNLQKLRRQSIECSNNQLMTKLNIERRAFPDEIERALNLDVYSSIIEKELDIESLHKIKNFFHAPELGNEKLVSLFEFRHMLKMILPPPLAQDEKMNLLFRKIDSFNAGAISWDDFCTHMQIYFKEHFIHYTKMRQTNFELPAKVFSSPHKEAVTSIFHASKDGTLATVGADGVICFWSSGFHLKRWKPVYVSHICHLCNIWLNKAFNSDREILFFELSSLEPYCCLTGLESVPLCLTHGWTKERPEECLLIWGDCEGCVSVLKLSSMTEALLSWKKSPVHNRVASASMETVILNKGVQFVQWKVHSDWVAKLMYEPSLNQIFSCSHSEANAMVIGSVLPSPTSSILSKVSKDASNPHDDNKIDQRTKTSLDEDHSTSKNETH
ncbi:WD40 repeat domain 95 [Cichlidogyrus casuarinus]|uniref:WD40 repeat domain 95 n=1 Tax=Cichlidogyrus casuarinus TaxID=1844966 RepID=A0ABD2QDP6_9PLAT